MVNRNLIRNLDLGSEEMERELDLAMADGGTATRRSNGAAAIWPSTRSSKAASSASTTSSCWSTSATRAKAPSPLNEWEESEEPPQVGDKLKVLIEEVEDVHGQLEESRGMIALSASARPRRSKPG